MEVQAAVDEACTNIIKYAYGEARGIITITCSTRDNNFMVSIKDKGKPFNPSSVPLPDLKADVNHRKIGGLGIYLMRNLMDDVTYDFDPKSGNTLVMKKIIH